jgi:hypothetical protein
MLLITRFHLAYNIAFRIIESPDVYIGELKRSPILTNLDNDSVESISMIVEEILHGGQATIVDYVYYLQMQKEQLTDIELLAILHHELAFNDKLSPEYRDICQHLYLAINHRFMFVEQIDYLNYSIDISLGKR